MKHETWRDFAKGDHFRPSLWVVLTNICLHQYSLARNPIKTYKIATDSHDCRLREKLAVHHRDMNMTLFPLPLVKKGPSNMANKHCNTQKYPCCNTFRSMRGSVLGLHPKRRRCLFCNFRCLEGALTNEFSRQNRPILVCCVGTQELT